MQEKCLALAILTFWINLKINLVKIIRQQRIYKWSTRQYLTYSMSLELELKQFLNRTRNTSLTFIFWMTKSLMSSFFSRIYGEKHFYSMPSLRSKVKELQRFFSSDNSQARSFSEKLKKSADVLWKSTWVLRINLIRLKKMKMKKLLKSANNQSKKNQN